MILRVLALVIAVAKSQVEWNNRDYGPEPEWSNKLEFDMYDIYADEVRDLVHRDLASNQGSKSRKKSCAS